MNFEPAMMLVLAILLPFISASAQNFVSSFSRTRDFVGMFFAASQILLVYELIKLFLVGDEIKAELFQILPDIAISFKVEALGIIYASVASCLWLVTLIYAHGYLKANAHKNLNRFYIFFSIAIACSMGIAFADNLLTMFIFYEAMTLCTYPLVTHNGDEKSKRSGRVYLGILIGTSVAFFLTAIIWTNNITGTTSFAYGGVFGNSEVVDNVMVALLLLFAFGIGKAALMPFHKWLPAAMVAPTPVSALLHAVAVVKAGVFCITKIIFYILGTEKLASVAGAEWLSYIAAFTILTASIIALRQDNLKLRLAYSTIAQLSYVVLAAALFNIYGIIAAAMHIVAHAVAKITLFFSAGAIATSTGKKYISELDGVGRKMPLVCTAFFITSLSMIGIPFIAGGESKDLIKYAASDNWVIYVLYISMALNAAYYLPISYRAFFKKGDFGKATQIPFTMKFAITITTILTISYIAYMDKINYVLEKL